jgi:Virulence factor BrkB
VSITLLTFGPQIGSWSADQVGLGGIFQTAWNALCWPVIAALLILATALSYYVALDVEQEWQWITPGSVVAVSGEINPEIEHAAASGKEPGKSSSRAPRHRVLPTSMRVIRALL